MYFPKYLYKTFEHIYQDRCIEEIALRRKLIISVTSCPVTDSYSQIRTYQLINVKLLNILYHIRFLIDRNKIKKAVEERFGSVFTGNERMWILSILIWFDQRRAPVRSLMEKNIPDDSMFQSLFCCNFLCALHPKQLQGCCQKECQYAHGFFVYFRDWPSV